jgi:hypothetical protein
LKSIIDKYKIDAIWHFTDKSNVELIIKNQGLHSFGALRTKGIAIPAPGGNQWSHDADELKGVHEYVHLAFLDDHPMLYAAKQDSRIKEPIWLKIDSSLLLGSDVRFTKEVSNKAGVEILTPEEAEQQIDFEVLFARTNWKDPEVQKRRRAALKSEILIPNHVPIIKILDMKNG